MKPSLSCGLRVQYLMYLRKQIWVCCEEILLNTFRLYFPVFYKICIVKMLEGLFNAQFFGCPCCSKSTKAFLDWAVLIRTYLDFQNCLWILFVYVKVIFLPLLINRTKTKYKQRKQACQNHLTQKNLSPLWISYKGGNVRKICKTDNKKFLVDFWKIYNVPW